MSHHLYRLSMTGSSHDSPAMYFGWRLTPAHRRWPRAFSPRGEASASRRRWHGWAIVRLALIVFGLWWAIGAPVDGAPSPAPSLDEAGGGDAGTLAVRAEAGKASSLRGEAAWQRAEQVGGSYAVELWINQVLAHLTLEEKIGQLFMIHGYGASSDDDRLDMREHNRQLHHLDTMQEVVERYRVGGVIYFTWTDNLHDPEQIARLSNGLQQVALSAPPRIPLFIAVDQEHGVVQRIGEPVTEFPGSMAIGAGGDPGAAYTAALITGDELRAMGINLNFAPVADVNVNAANPVIGVRSFGDRSEQVSRYVAAQVAGYRAARVAATAKHFPGHGNTDVDSHIGLPLIPYSGEEVETIDLPPFAAAIEAGVDAIMTAHIVVPALDDTGRPATLSAPILTGLLRERLGFQGLIVTDALTMAGAQQSFDPQQVPVEAIRAGADILLMPPDLSVAYEAVLAAVRRGEVSEERIEESVRRILRVKFAQGLFEAPFVDEEAVSTRVGVRAHREAARRIAEQSVTVVKNAAGYLPLFRSSGSAANGHGETDMLVTGWGVATTKQLAAALQGYGIASQALPTGAAPDDPLIAEAVQQAQEHDAVVVLTRDVGRDSRQQTLVHALLATGKPVIVVAVGTPYDIGFFPQAQTFVAAYGYRRVTLEALARVLVGAASPSGRLPVGVPLPHSPGVDLYPAGHGLGL